MMRRGSIAFGLLVGGLGLVADLAFTDEPAGMPPEMRKEMEEWTKLGTPGKEHETLAALAGDWTVDGQHFMGTLSQPMKGTSKMTPIFGKRFVREEFRSEFMGEPFEGTAVFGFDNAERKYVGSWVDSMSTTIATLSGAYDAATKTYAWTMAPMKGPGGKTYEHRLTVKVVSD
jgi:hypothetical protein